MFTKAFIAAALATAVSAGIPNLQGRQDTAGLTSPECTSALANIEPIYAQLPSEPPALASATLPTDPCVTPDFTGSLSSEYAQYTGEVMSWFAANSDALLSALGQCTELTSFTGEVHVCTNAPTTGGPVIVTATATATDTGAAPYPTGGVSSSYYAGSGTAPTSSAIHSSTAAPSTTAPIPTGAAAAREAGVLAAAAVAGVAVLGAIAL